MPRQQRYEPVPQRDENIILESIRSPSYNYNSGIATSVASSIHGSGYPPSIPPSIPNSPPPSFHTHSSPGTPRPSQSTLHTTASSAHHAELWGVAPSTIGGETINTSNDALATIAGLKRRVEMLEESIGRLLLEKEETTKHDEGGESNYCCVTFTDVSPDLEQAFMGGKGSHCCVTFSGATSAAKRKERRLMLFGGLLALFLICGTLSLTLTSGIKHVDIGVDKASELMDGK